MAGFQFPALTRTVRGLLSKLQGQHFDGDRDLYEIFGYPRTLVPNDYLAEYIRNGLAGRIIDAFPEATWREPPTIKAMAEDENGPFAKAVEQIVKDFGLWQTLARLDRLTALGHYGVLLFGVAGGEPLDQPLNETDAKLIFLSPHGERSADVVRWEKQPSSPRFGKPDLYRLTIGVNWTGVGGSERSVNVHHSRTIHVTEKPLDDNSIGIPRLERIYNRLLDIDKLLGGSAEVYWQNAAGLRVWSADPEAEWDPESRSDMESQLQEITHGLRRDARVQGIDAKLLAAEPEDPTGHIDKQLDIIAGAIGIPKRILIGSERGELSSEQDENNWAARIAERREQFATPAVIRPVLDWFIARGIIDEPAGGDYVVEWPESDSLGEAKRAEIAKNKAEALSAYITNPGAEDVIPPQEFRAWLGETEISEFRSPNEEPDAELDELDGEVAGAFGDARGDAAAAQAQDTALNGAQIQSIKELVEAVGNKTMAPESAVRLIMLGFPLVDELTARRIVAPMESFTPAATAAATEAIDGMRQPTINRIVTTLQGFKANAQARPLYVRRDVVNAEELRAYARTLGIRKRVPAGEMHVTIAFSRKPVDWISVGEAFGNELVIPAGGPRVVEVLGDKAIVLLFASSELGWRHEEIKQCGASWDYPTYQPHVTLTYDGPPDLVDELKAGKFLEPFRGEIRLGPEIFEELRDDWSDGLVENRRAF